MYNKYMPAQPSKTFGLKTIALSVATALLAGLGIGLSIKDKPAKPAQVAQIFEFDMDVPAHRKKTLTENLHDCMYHDSIDPASRRKSVRIIEQDGYTRTVQAEMATNGVLSLEVQNESKQQLSNGRSTTERPILTTTFIAYQPNGQILHLSEFTQVRNAKGIWEDLERHTGTPDQVVDSLTKNDLIARVHGRINLSDYTYKHFIRPAAVDLGCGFAPPAKAALANK